MIEHIDPVSIEQKFRELQKTEGLARATAFVRQQKPLWREAPRLEYLYYGLSGDLAQEIAEPTSRLMRQAAARGLKRLLPRVKDPDLRSAIRNEIYFHRRQFHRQRLLGFDGLRRSGVNGDYFSIGVGAWAQAEVLRRRGLLLRSARFAKEADWAWTVLIGRGGKRQDVFAFAGMTKLLLGDLGGAKALFDKTRQACPTPRVLADYATDDIIVHSFKRCIGLVKPGPIGAATL